MRYLAKHYNVIPLSDIYGMKKIVKRSVVITFDLSGPDARRDKRETQGIGTAGHSDGEPRLAELREVAVEILNHGATNEPASVECDLKNRAQIFSELAVNSDKIEKGNLTRAH